MKKPILSVAIPGTQPNQNDRILMADALGHIARLGEVWVGYLNVMDKEWDGEKYVELPCIEVQTEFPKPIEEGEKTKTAILEGLKKFIESREDAEKYVQKGYDWMDEDQQGRKTIEVRNRVERAKEILTACQEQGLTVVKKVVED